MFLHFPTAPVLPLRPTLGFLALIYAVNLSEIGLTAPDTPPAAPVHANRSASLESPVTALPHDTGLRYTS